MEVGWPLHHPGPRSSAARSPGPTPVRTPVMPRSTAVPPPTTPLAAGGLVLVAVLVSCSDSPADPGLPGGPNGPGPPVLTEGTELYTYDVVGEHPHDPDAFTQGLVLQEGVLFESTGLYGESSLRRVDRTTGAVLQRHDLAPDLFGEGITVLGDQIVQLTWTSAKGFVYDRESFQPERQFSYETEGWGLTHDGNRLVMSDGTARLYFLDPLGLDVVGEVSVTWQGAPVERLNELEYIDGHVFANVWLTDRIAIIDPGTGRVVSWLDLEGLLPPDERDDADVLNGIAFDAETGYLLVTGKLWPRLYEIELVPAG